MLYVSTDLSYAKARSVWHNFGLHNPIERDRVLQTVAPGQETDQKKHPNKGNGPDCIGVWPYQPFGEDTSDATLVDGIYDRDCLHKPRPLISYLRPASGP